MVKTLRGEIDSIGWLMRTATLAAIAGAIYQELRLPAEERTWHGRLLGFVPYDFRLPTPKRVIDSFWNPKSKQLFTDQPFGVGWAVNVPAAITLVRGLLNRAQSTKTTTATPRRRTTAKATAA